MFNKNEFINWAKSAQQDNVTMKDFRSSHFNPMNQVTKESVQLDEINPVLAIGGIGLGYAAAKGLRDRQKKSIEKRAQASADAYGGTTERPYNFGDKRREREQKEKLAKEKTENVEEGLLGGMVKAGLAGAAIYGGIKGAKAIRNKWKAKQAATQASNAEDTPSTPPSKQSREVLGMAVQKAKDYASQRIKNDPASRAVATKGLKKAGGLANKAGAWLTRKAAGMAAASK
jgi:hypothetical protein